MGIANCKQTIERNNRIESSSTSFIPLQGRAECRWDGTHDSDERRMAMKAAIDEKRKEAISCYYSSRRALVGFLLVATFFQLIFEKRFVLRSLDTVLCENECAEGLASLPNVSAPDRWIAIGNSPRTFPSAVNLLHGKPRQYVFVDEHHTNNSSSSSKDAYPIRVLGESIQYGPETPNQQQQQQHTIVTAYYEIPSKHSPSSYNKWMKNFLGRYNDTIVLFTSPHLFDRISEFRCGDTSLCFPTLLVGLPLQELPVGTLYPKSFWVDQLDRDPEARAHSPLRGDPRMKGQFESGELYWIWLSKIWFVTEAMTILNTFRHHRGNIINDNENDDDDVFAWIDVGSFRKDKSSSTPTRLLEHTEIVPYNEVLFWSYAGKRMPSNNATTATFTFAPTPPETSPYFDDKIGHPRFLFHAGAQFVGRKRAIREFYIHFLDTIDVFVERNMTLVDDQTLLQSTCLSYFHRRASAKATAKNLCAYADRSMASSKWFGLALLLEKGPKAMDTYWRPPPPTHYGDERKQYNGNQTTEYIVTG